MLESHGVIPAEVFVFGPFTLDKRARLLSKDGAAIPLGSRAFDLLALLVERAGNAVTKKELLAAVWKDISVDESTLRFHVAGIRKVLGRRGEEARYLQTLAGQGYCFVAPVMRTGSPMVLVAEEPPRVAPPRPMALPPTLAGMVGRAETCEHISRLLLQSRFVTVTGPGGIGKTTLALAVLHTAVGELGGAACFVDLGSLTDPKLVSTAVSAALLLPVQSQDPVVEVVTYLRDKQIILLLDCCEPVIETAAALAECLYRETPGVHLLATSREALRAEGENVVSLTPLDSPPPNSSLSLQAVQSYPAAKLFCARAVASGWRADFIDADAPLITEICNRLDGLPLAIELAAGLVEIYGLRGVTELLKDRFEVLGQGRRTSVPRHKTLAATLDWSYDLLSAAECAVLDQLAAFVGPFTLEAMRFVAETEGDEMPEALLASLVSKSLVSVKTEQQLAKYRLLDTTRSYAWRKLTRRGNVAAVMERHARFYLSFLQQIEADLRRGPASNADRADQLGNFRAALTWAFSEAGDPSLASALAAAVAPVFLELSLLVECRQWCEHALQSTPEGDQSIPVKIDLLAAYGLTVMFTKSNSDEARIALEKGLELAEQAEDVSRQFRLSGRLHLFFYRTGDFRTSLIYAEKCDRTAAMIEDPMAAAAAHSLLGISHHLLVDLNAAYRHFDAALVSLPPSQYINKWLFGMDYRNRAAICMARTLWLLGYPDRAAQLSHQTVEEAEKSEHPLTLCIALVWAVSTFLWIGDCRTAERYVRRLVEHSRSRSIIPYPSAGIGVEGCLAISRGEADAGVPLVRKSLEELYRQRYHLLTTVLYNALALGCLQQGSPAQAMEAVEKAFATVEQNGDLHNLPEVLRIKGEILAATEPQGSGEAEGCYLRSLELARSYSAKSWELRTTNSLACLWIRQGRRDEARSALQQIMFRFTEGFDTPDFAEARGLLTELSTPSGD